MSACSSLANLQVVQAYQAGVSALRLSLKDTTVERAENLVDQIQEVTFSSDSPDCYVVWDVIFSFCDFCQLCDTQDDVAQTLSGGVTGAGMMNTLRLCNAAPCVFGGVSFCFCFFSQMETWTSWRKN